MADNNLFGITCPTDCATSPYPSVETINPDCPFPAGQSEITDILVMHPTLGQGPADWTLALGVGNWNDVIDNSDATGVKVKRFSVEGSIDAPTRPTITMPNFKQFQGEGTYTLTATFKSLPQGIYDFLREMQCGTVNPIIWFIDADGNMYGQQDGITTVLSMPEFIFGLGKDSYTNAPLQLQWESQVFPQRIVSPI